MDEVKPISGFTRTDLALVLVLATAATALRAWELTHTTVASRDSIGYARIAWRLEHGDWRKVIAHAPQHPLYPAALLLVSQPIRHLLPDDLPYAMQLSAQLTSALAGVLLVLPSFLLGRELFRFTTQRLDDKLAANGTLKMMGAPSLQAGPITAKLDHIQLTGELIKEYNLDKPETTIGRSTGDLVFKNDPYMSGTHARVVAQPGRFVLQDLKSRNGVYRRIRDELELKNLDEFFLGEQLFRVEIQEVED